jgi:hypothetical protein
MQFLKISVLEILQENIPSPQRMIIPFSFAASNNFSPCHILVNVTQSKAD